MIQAEYRRFLQTLTTQNSTENIRKIANLVLEHLDNIESLTTYQGQRAKKIVELTQSNWNAIRPDTQPAIENILVPAHKIVQLNYMSVGPFRGFARKEEFDLASRLILIYGPNGTGKSSFCEALEYGLLGAVAEAENKRFRDQRDYLRNAHVNQFSPPDLRGVDIQGDVVPVEPNEKLYRFCFVEKNRIDNFSRIAAQAPAKQTELISTLFGLELFSEFVRNFTPEIDGRYIDLVGIKTTLLAQKRQGLAGAQQQLSSNHVELQAVELEAQRLATQYREGFSFSHMTLELNGDERTQGIVQQLEIALQSPIAAKSNVTSAGLDALRNSIESNIDEFVIIQQQLAAASQQISFKQLYDAISQVQQSSPEQCPACKTSLNQVTVNPYIFANQQLQQLQHLSTLQQAAQNLEQNIVQLLFNLSQIINTCLTYFLQKNPLSLYRITNNAHLNSV